MTAPKMRTVQVQFSDAEIRRQAQGPAKTLRDLRHPGARFRFHQSRESGSWYVIVKGEWHKVGSYPQLNAKGFLSALPGVVARLTADPAAVVGQSGWVMTSELLTWYRARVLGNRALTAKRKDSVRAVLDLHLLPRLGELPLLEISRATVDQHLMWPLQQEFSPGYLRQILRVLMMAFQQALRLQMIEANPLAAVKFTEFVQAKVKPKAARLHGLMAEQLLAVLGARFDAAPAEGMLALMMLAHGTRIGETRRAQWRHISLAERVWLIPAENTKTRSEHVLPLTDQMCALLKRYRDLRAARGRSDGYLFTDWKGHLLSEKQASEVFARLSGGEWSSHDLRKLARTGWADLGVDYLIGELLLNHAMGFAAQTYIHTTADDLKLDALKRWHGWLDQRGFSDIHRWTGVDSPETTNTTNAAPSDASSAFREVQKERQKIAAEQGESQ